jgi:hypothetical protein
MNRKQLVTLLVIVVALGAAGLYIKRRNETSWQSSNQSIGKKLLGDLPVNDVAAILIKSNTNELVLAKKDNLWRVKERNDYPANYSEISGFLLKAADLKAVQTEEIGKSQLGRYKLLPPGQGTNSAMLVELRDQNGKAIKSLLLGKPHMRKAKGRMPAMDDMGGDEGWPDGRYLMVGADAKTVAVVSDPLSNIEPTPSQWLNKDFFKVEKVRSISVAYPVATNCWKVTRETESGDWKLADAKPAEQLDSSKTSGLSSALSSPSFSDVATTAKPEDLGLNKPTVVALDTFDDFTYTIKVGQKTNDIIPMTLTVAAQLPKERVAGKDEKPEDKTRLDKEFKDKQKKLEEKLAQEKSYEKWIYLVSGWTLDSVLKERAQLLAEKKEEPKKDAKPAVTDSSKKDETPAASPDSAKQPEPSPKPDDTKPKTE